jgi:putative ABC transport system substrate-binding protein
VNRRELVLLLGTGAIAVSAPPALHALAQDKVWRIGFLDLHAPPTADEPSRNLEAFQRGLSELGYKEGRNYVIDVRFADTDKSRLPALAKELVDRRVDVIVTIGTPPVQAAKAATATIPIVMAGSNNPVETGLVASLAHPGGNVTGLTHNAGPAIVGKGLQLLKEAAPNISRVAILWDSPDGNWSAVEATLHLTLLPHYVGGVQSAADFDAILSKIKEERADAVFVFPEFVNLKYQNELLNFVSTNRLPSAFQEALYVEKGGLLSYYTDFLDLRRRAALYVDKIFRGAKPEDLPVEEPDQFVLVVNLKTAHTLDLTVPQSILLLADKLIE